MCREIPQWYQNQHGEVACEIHRYEKFSYKSLAEIKKEREFAERGQLFTPPPELPRG
jgi:hypothetical protein